MTPVLLILLLLVIFITTDNKSSLRNRKIEPFSGDVFAAGSTPPIFGTSNGSGDYYSDRSGRKGILYNHGVGYQMYQSPKKITTPVNYDNTIKMLEAYPETFYKPCVSKYNPDMIKQPKINNDVMNSYLTFNQGTLHRSKYSSPRSGIMQ